LVRHCFFLQGINTLGRDIRINNNTINNTRVIYNEFFVKQC
jgi:hypothetical protein